MNRLLFRQRLNHLHEDALRFQNTLCAYETTDAVRYPENFERLGLDMARQAESIACSTRNIVSIFQMNGREQVQSCAAEAQGITVKEQSYGYEVILPHLMPKRNHRNHTVFLLEPLTYALKEFTAVHPICRLEYALIWFIYEYTEDTPIHCIRDYDNIETKEVLDIINSFFLLDDGGAFCELHYSTRRGNRTCTRVIISSDIGLVSCQKIKGN